MCGNCEFHFLYPSSTYHLELVVEGSSEPLFRGSFDTQALGRAVPRSDSRWVSRDLWRVYIGEEHDLGEWLGTCPQDMVWVYRPSYALLRNLWWNACFTLPSKGSPITHCPNPMSRYCVDLTKPCKWLGGKKVKRFRKQFLLTVNRDYKGTFKRCAELHAQLGSGQWITPELVDALDRCRQEDGAIKVYSIELWDKNSTELAAAIMAFSVGDIFHDYTTAAFLRDDRSPGAILTKVTGHLLAGCGYTLWYWGFKNPYMAEYDGRYGGVQMDNNSEFWPLWRAAREKQPCDLVNRVPHGEEVDLANL